MAAAAAAAGGGVVECRKHVRETVGTRTGRPRLGWQAGVRRQPGHVLPSSVYVRVCMGVPPYQHACTISTGAWMDIRVRVCPCKFHLAVYAFCMYRFCMRERMRMCVHVGVQVRALVLLLLPLRRRVRVHPVHRGLDISIPSRWLHILGIRHSPIHRVHEHDARLALLLGRRRCRTAS